MTDEHEPAPLPAAALAAEVDRLRAVLRALLAASERATFAHHCDNTFAYMCNCGANEAARQLAAARDAARAALEEKR